MVLLVVCLKVKGKGKLQEGKSNGKKGSGKKGGGKSKGKNTGLKGGASDVVTRGGVGRTIVDESIKFLRVRIIMTDIKKIASWQYPQQQQPFGVVHIAGSPCNIHLLPIGCLYLFCPNIAYTPCL